MNDKTMKRILPWKDDINQSKKASTLMGDYRVHEWKIGRTTYRAVWTIDCANQRVDSCDTLDAAMDACEADYLERCTEFLRLAGPGQCVVDAESINVILGENCDGCSLGNRKSPMCCACIYGPLRRQIKAIKEARDGK